MITGASSGIGLATARVFAQEGDTVWNLSRSACPLDGVRSLTVDVTDEASVARALETVVRESGRLDLLVCCAGFGISGAVEFTGAEAVERQFAVNVFGTVRCMRLALPQLRASGGRIICISSAAAVFPIPFQAFYSASKTALNSIVAALANELRGTGASACAIMLGDVRTGFTDAREKNEQGGEVYGAHLQRAVAVMERDERQGMPPERVAAAVCRIAEKRHVKPLYTVGAKYKLFLMLERLLPKRFVSYVLNKMY